MSWVVGRIDAVAPTAIERETRIRVGRAVTIALVGALCTGALAAAAVVSGDVYRGLANLLLVASVAPLCYVAWVSHVTYRRSEQPASTLVFAVGVFGLTATGLAGLLLAIVHLTSITPPTGPLETLRAVGFLATGLWFVGLSALEYGIHVVSSWVASYGFVAGFGGVLLGAGVLFVGETHLVSIAGLAVFIAGFVPWAVVLRGHLLAGYE